MECKYRMREDEIKDEDGVLHTVYGVDVLSRGELVRSVPDVFFEKERAEYYIGLFNTLGLRPIQLDDVLEEIL